MILEVSYACSRAHAGTHLHYQVQVTPSLQVTRGLSPGRSVARTTVDFEQGPFNDDVGANESAERSQ